MSSNCLLDNINEAVGVGGGVGRRGGGDGGEGGGGGVAGWG